MSDPLASEVLGAVEVLTVETESTDSAAQDDIARAISARHSIARNYLRRLRRPRPEATPAEVIRLLERQYLTAIATAGTAVAVGGFAASVGISLIPLGGIAATGAKTAAQQTAKKAATEAAKKAALQQAGKGLALGAARSGAERLQMLLPAGERQLQFEITAIFGLALADIHGMELDRDQARALVYGLTNERVNQQQIATMAADIAAVSQTRPPLERSVGAEWATTLASALPGESAAGLVRTMQTGQLDAVHDALSGKQRAAIDYGVRAVSGGVSSFVFGSDVVDFARHAFPEAPDAFPPHLSVTPSDELDRDTTRGMLALEQAARTTGSRIAGAADSATRIFRSVDLDGDGMPDEAQALTAVKNAGGAVAGAAGSVSSRVGGLLKRPKREAASSDSGGDVLGLIANLALLRDEGALTDEEFTAKKAELLARV